MATATVVILGGGVGGQIAANELRRHLPAPHRVVVVDQFADHAFAPSFTWVMAGLRRPEQVKRPLQRLLAPGVERLEGRVQAIDCATRRVRVDGQALAYDYLLVALGAEMAPDLIPGLREAAHTFYSLEGAIRLSQLLPNFAGGRIAVVICRSPYKCPGAPHEGAMLLHQFFRHRGMRDRVDLQVYSCEPRPMPDTGPEMGAALLGLLEQRGIGFHAEHRLESVDPQRRELHFAGREPVGYDLLLAVPPHQGPQLLQEAGLAGERGWVPVDPLTLATEHERVYALGDVTALRTPGRWQPETPLYLPKGGVFAHGQGLVVARRLAAEITGGRDGQVFGGHGFCVVDVGRCRAVAALADFFAQPQPVLRLFSPSRPWHCGKVLFENWWLTPPGPRKGLLRLALSVGCGRLGLEM
jgi:sulfide:quinone oxidoreductase